MVLFTMHDAKWNYVKFSMDFFLSRTHDFMFLLTEDIFTHGHILDEQESASVVLVNSWQFTFIPVCSIAGRVCIFREWQHRLVFVWFKFSFFFVNNRAMVSVVSSTVDCGALKISWLTFCFQCVCRGGGLKRPKGGGGGGGLVSLIACFAWLVILPLAAFWSTWKWAGVFIRFC